MATVGVKGLNDVVAH